MKKNTKGLISFLCEFEKSPKDRVMSKHTLKRVFVADTNNDILMRPS